MQESEDRCPNLLPKAHWPLALGRGHVTDAIGLWKFPRDLQMVTGEPRWLRSGAQWTVVARENDGLLLVATLVAFLGLSNTQQPKMPHFVSYFCKTVNFGLFRHFYYGSSTKVENNVGKHVERITKYKIDEHNKYV